MPVSKVEISCDSRGLLTSIRIEGHSGNSKLGDGLEVCIALSTLAQSLLFALQEMVGRDFCKCIAKSGNFLLECDLSCLACDKINDYNLITKSYLVNIKKLSREYQDYIKYTEE